MDGSPKELFLQSLERCTGNEAFIPSFYDRFLGASAEIREKFEETDFEQQHKMLLQSLRLSAGATAGDAAALQEIRLRAETHDRHHLDIAPRLYDTWLESVIQTAREVDPEWSELVENAWNTILGYVVKHMTRSY